MKFFKIGLFLFFIGIFPVTIFAQTFDPETDAQAREIIRNTLQHNMEKARQERKQIDANQVFITQIGEGNSINTQNTSETSVSNYVQQGSFNNISSQINAKHIENNILQSGDNNKILNQSFVPNDEAILNVSQNGQNINFENYGSNSIGNGLKFNVQGNGKTIIVRNFK